MSSLAKTLAERNDEDYKKGDVHQAILNLVYDHWRSRKGATYGDAIAWAELELGPVAAFAVLFGKYNYQVCNGGHDQYFDNGYASGGGRVSLFGDPVLDLHKKMVKLFRELKFDSTKLGREILAILEEFKVQNVEGFHYEWDEDEEIEIEVEDPAYLQVENGDTLDARYYNINDAFVKHLNERFTKALT